MNDNINLTARSDSFNILENNEFVAANKDVDLNLDPSLSFANLIPKKGAVEEEEEEEEDEE